MEDPRELLTYFLGPRRIRRLAEVVAESSKQGYYNKWVKREREIVEQGLAPDLASHLFKRYCLDGLSVKRLSRELGVSANGLNYFLQKINIPIDSNRCNNDPISEEHRKNLRKAWETRPPVSEETKRKQSESLTRRMSLENRAQLIELIRGEIST